MIAKRNKVKEAVETIKTCTADELETILQAIQGVAAELRRAAEANEGPGMTLEEEEELDYAEAFEDAMEEATRAWQIRSGN